MLSHLVYASLHAAGITALTRGLRDAAVVLCYHNVVDEGDGPEGADPGLHLPLARFQAQVAWLADHYRVVSLAELTHRIETGVSLRRLAAITFDDAYAGTFEHAWPHLRALGLPATVFVVTGAPGGAGVFWWDHPALAHAADPDARRRWLLAMGGDGRAILRALEPGDVVLPPARRAADWATIRAAARAGAGLTLGAHSTTHRTLPLLGDAELEEEINASRDTIYQETGSVAEFFSYPYGLWDRRVRDAVRRAGYHGAVTLDAGLNAAAADPWALRRVNIPGAIPPRAFEAWVAGLQPRTRLVA